MRGDLQEIPRAAAPARPFPAADTVCQPRSIQCGASHVQNAIKAVEKITGASSMVDEQIWRELGNCLTETDLGLGKRTVGKVRDTYDLGDKLLIVTTDRLSAFDRVLTAIPFKGQVLNQTSAWWMSHCADIVPHALLRVPHPNVAIMRKCQVFPVEFVVRGFLTGNTDTSLWTHYNRGERSYCGHSFPDGMQKNQRLPRNVLTPTTKAVDHDVPISAADIVDQGLMTQQHWDQASSMALALFEEGQREALTRGLLLVDTKYEFGLSPEGNVLVVDEVHTPDSSRYWLADSYEARHAAGEEPQSIDKEFLRLWFREHCDPYNDEVLPQAPTDLTMELSRRYMMLYETITDEVFSPTPFDIHQLKADVGATLQFMNIERARKRSQSRQQQQ
ncbi:hypothetical protein WJX73_007255 [Symbiochloris irregularis]|uniref:phosphoribosylaminoimidazolesuccinocarboxamide synthase n=1 Tax=Symbiochloris irregularis TaxID=706552 RepID=A0AAW1P0T7_9CHLO